MRVRRGRRRSYRKKSSSKMRKRFDVQPQLMFGYPMQCKATAGDLQKIGVPVPMPRTYSAINSYRDWETDRKSTRLNSSHSAKSRMPSSA